MTNTMRQKYETLNNKTDELKEQVRVIKNSDNRFKGLMLECLLIKLEELHVDFARLMVENDDVDREELDMWEVAREKLDNVEAMFA